MDFRVSGEKGIRGKYCGVELGVIIDAAISEMVDGCREEKAPFVALFCKMSSSL